MMTLEAALAEHKALLLKLATLEQEVRLSLERESILQGRVETLNEQLFQAKSRGDHYAKWNAELLKACSNIQVQIDHEMSLVNEEMKRVRGNGPDATEAIERALTHEPIQHQGER